MTPEGKVKADVKKYLDEIGAYWFMPVQTGYGAPTLDFLVCHRGAFIAIETKAPGREASARQRAIMKKIDRTGGYAVVVDDVEKLKTYLNRIFTNKGFWAGADGLGKKHVARP